MHDVFPSSENAVYTRSQRADRTLDLSVEKQFVTGGLRYTNLTLAPTGSHMNKYVQGVLVS
jgi:hypothetical protein